MHRVRAPLRSVLWGLLLALVGCQTDTGVVRGGVVEPTIAFQPEDVVDDATAPILAQPGARHPDLFSAESFAVFLNQGLLLARLEADARAYRYPKDQVAAERRRITKLAGEFVICELHLVSKFGDLGMANDAVSLRNVRATLSDDTGRTTAPAAIQSGGSEEIQYPDSTTVMRIMLVFFPRVLFPDEPPLIQSTTQRLRLFLTGEGSTFAAEWALNPTFQP